MKKIGAWFTKGIPNGSGFRQNLHACEDPELLFAMLERLKEPGV
jgi:hypothetical protein